MKPEKIIYTTEVTATGGRDGRAVSEDKNLAVKLVVPKEFGGPGGIGTNPEQLFAAGYSACFLSAVKLMGRLSKVPIAEDSTVTAKIGVGTIDVGYIFTAELEIRLPGIPLDKAKELVAGAHERCPFSRATKGNVDVVFTILEA